MVQLLRLGSVGRLGSGGRAPSSSSPGLLTFSDDFNRANTSAGDLGTASGGFTYTRIGGDVGGRVLDNQFYTDNSDAERFRAEQDLATEDMFSQLDGVAYQGAGGGDTDFVPMCRVSDSADTGYALLARVLRTPDPDDLSYTLQRRVSGTPTNIGSFTEQAPTLPITVRLTTVGDEICAFGEDNLLKVATTDTNITGNTHAGIGLFGGLDFFADNFLMGEIVEDITLSEFRFYDDGSEAGAVAAAAANTNINRNSTPDDGTNAQFQLRVVIQDNAGFGASSNDDYQIDFRINGGAWTDVANDGITTQPVSMHALGGLFNGVATTQRLSGTGDFRSGKQVETFHNSGINIGLHMNGNTEIVFGMKLIDAQVSSSDFIEFRVQRNGVALGGLIPGLTVN